MVTQKTQNTIREFTVGTPHGAVWVLVWDKTSKPALAGERLVDFRGDHATLVGGMPPHWPGSEGRVHVRIDCPDGQRTDGSNWREYYPSVYGLKWDLQAAQ